jgi:uncharacterized oxidoreductase
MTTVGERYRLVPAPRLRDLTQRIFEGAGADEEGAASLASSLVLSNLRGVDSHGFMRVVEYLDRIRSGRIDPAARPIVSHEEGVLLRVDGQKGFGQLAARLAALRATEKAKQHGLALATAANIVHVGRLGEYVELAVEQRCFALACCNGGPAGGNVAPFGGRQAALATNPIAYGIPAGERPPLIADFSTSMSAEGKIRLFLQAGTLLPGSWIIDSDGNPSNDPRDLYSGGAILPMADHKGFALSLMVEILGGLLAGAGCASLGQEAGNGFVIIVLDIARLQPIGAFAAGVDSVVAALQAVPPAAGFSRVVVPGEPENVTQQERERAGIPVSEETWRLFREAARSVDVDVDDETVGWETN